MSILVLLDSGPLGLVTNPRATPENEHCKQWFAVLSVNGIRVLVPEITDYEVRRELLRAGKRRGIARLDQLKVTAGYVPLTTPMMLHAAELWAQARQQGLPTADALGRCSSILPAGNDAISHGQCLLLPAGNLIDELRFPASIAPARHFAGRVFALTRCVVMRCGAVGEGLYWMRRCCRDGSRRNNR